MQIYGTWRRRILCVSTATLLHSLRLFADCRDVPLARLLRDARNAAGGRMAWFVPPDGETCRWRVSTSNVQHLFLLFPWGGATLRLASVKFMPGLGAFVAAAIRFFVCRELILQLVPCGRLPCDVCGAGGCGTLFIHTKIVGICCMSSSSSPLRRVLVWECW